MDTRQKILEAALELFNEIGPISVTLRHIAEKCGISVGNLAYHFPKQGLLAEELYNQMEQENNILLSAVQSVPGFENIQIQTQAILRQSWKYRFFYLYTPDLLLHYPALASLHCRNAARHIAYIQAMIDYSVGVGNMHPEPEKGQYQALAETVWMQLYFWNSRARILGSQEPDFANALRNMWWLVKPHLTHTGQHKLMKIYHSSLSHHRQ